MISSAAVHSLTLAATWEEEIGRRLLHPWRWHRPIFPRTLPICSRLPGANQTDRREKPEQERRQSAERESRESKHDKENREGCEKEVHHHRNVQR